MNHQEEQAVKTGVQALISVLCAGLDEAELKAMQNKLLAHMLSHPVETVADITIESTIAAIAFNKCTNELCAALN